MPHCPITDLTFQDNDLVVATSGRSFWILDDLSSIQERSLSDTEIQLITPKPSYRISTGGRGDLNLGKNPASGMLIDYYIPADLPDSIDIQMDITDSNGKLLRQYSSKADKSFKTYPGGPSKPVTLKRNKGVNRMNWNMRKDQLKGVDGKFLLGGYNGPMVPPGTYTITLTAGDQVKTMKAELLADPRIDATQREYDDCLLYTSPSPRDQRGSRMPSSA